VYEKAGFDESLYPGDLIFKPQPQTISINHVYIKRPRFVADKDGIAEVLSQDSIR
jgi:hypothetical protein